MLAVQCGRLQGALLRSNTLHRHQHELLPRAHTHSTSHRLVTVVQVKYETVSGDVVLAALKRARAEGSVPTLDLKPHELESRESAVLVSPGRRTSIATPNAPPSV